MEQTYNGLLQTTTEDYLSDIDLDLIPSPTTIEAELLNAVNKAITDYNMGPEDPNVAANASLKDRFPNQKQPSDRFRKLKKLEPYINQHFPYIKRLYIFSNSSKPFV